MNALNWLLEPLSYGFMWRGLLAASMVGLVCAILGAYVILRGMAFLGDALAHTILPGVVIAHLLGWPLAVGALIFGIFSAIGIGVLSDRGQIREDSAIGIIFAGSFALGITLLSTTRSYSTDLAHILFGNVLGVSVSDLWLSFGMSLFVLVTILAFYKEFLLLTFDPMQARVLRLPTTALRYLLLLLITIVIVIALQTVGVALVIAMLVTPATSAYLLTNRLPAMMITAALFGIVASIVGLYLSYYFNTASGPTIILTATVMFLVVFLFKPKRNVMISQA